MAFSTFFIKEKVYSDGSRSLPRNSPDCTLLASWVFDDVILADVILTDSLFAKALRSLKTCLSVNDNFFRKLASSLESSVSSDETFKVTLVLFFYSCF